MTAQAKVEVYVTTYCGYCRAAKRLLEERRVPYLTIDLTNDHDKREELVRKHQWTTVPLILADGELIGGYTDLVQLDKERGLDHLR